MPASAWTNVIPKLRAVIGGIEFLDIVAWSATFEVQSLPTCSLQVAVGRRVDTQAAATIHSSINELNQEVLCQVYLTVEQIGSSPGGAENWPTKEFKIFEGNVIGTGWARSGGAMRFIIHVLHWLADLHYSSSLSASSHPDNPASFTFSAAQGVYGGFNNTGAEPGWTTLCQEQGDISAQAVQEDLWGSAIQKFMLGVTTQERLTNANTPIPGGTASTNKAAAAALNRIAPIANVKSYVPLALQTMGADARTIALCIADALVLQSTTSWATTTLWGKLIGEFCPAFFMNLVPRVNDALVVPACPALRKPYLIIGGDEYDNCSISGQNPHALRAVGIFSGVGTNTGYNTAPAQQPVEDVGIIGWFEPIENGNGLIMLKDAPHWLSKVVQPWLYAVGSTGINGVVGMSQVPGVGDAPTQQSPSQIMNSFIGQGEGSVFSAYAQQLFVQEMLKGKQGELSGKLRFDIAPGSTVGLETVSDVFLDSGDELSDMLFATVTRLSHTIDVEGRRAGTAMSLAYVRNSAENKDQRTSMTKPALYTTPWPGAALIDF